MDFSSLDGNYVDLCNSCFKNTCRCEVAKFSCDALIAETVQVLNEKGYSTTFCCQGHLNYEKDRIKHLVQTYISFKERYWFEKSPENFEYKLFNNGCIVENVRTFLNDAKMKQTVFIINNNSTLREWAYDLPVFEGYYLDKVKR